MCNSDLQESCPKAAPQNSPAPRGQTAAAECPPFPAQPRPRAIAAPAESKPAARRPISSAAGACLPSQIGKDSDAPCELKREEEFAVALCDGGTRRSAILGQLRALRTE